MLSPARRRAGFGLKPVSLDDNSAADSNADPGPTAVSREQDSDRTPPGCGDPADPSGRISWMEVVRNATEREIQAKVAARGTAARGFVRLT
jgi:hypothetical protein